LRGDSCSRVPPRLQGAVSARSRGPAFTGSGLGPEGATRHPGRAVPNKSKACQQHRRQLSGFTGAVASLRRARQDLASNTPTLKAALLSREAVSLRARCPSGRFLGPRRLHFGTCDLAPFRTGLFLAQSPTAVSNHLDMIAFPIGTKVRFIESCRPPQVPRGSIGVIVDVRSGLRRSDNRHGSALGSAISSHLGSRHAGTTDELIPGRVA
jgi:hypothetical protein